MIQTYDGGSMPFTGDYGKFTIGSKPVEPLLTLLSSNRPSVERRYFEEKVVQDFINKVNVGIDIPSYPQFRDMNEMFLTLMRGVTKTRKGYQVIGPLSVKRGEGLIPELQAIRARAKEIGEQIHRTFKVKICVTGPYTLASAFIHRTSEMFKGLGKVLSQIVEENCFSTGLGGVTLLALDEPIFGFIDDPVLDYGSAGREGLLKSWEAIFDKAKAQGVLTCIHLHNTSNEAFWEVKSLDIVESHVNDPLYFSQRTRRLLEREDKFLKASISITDFDGLIRRSIETSHGRIDEAIINQRIADIWAGIGSGKIDPIPFLESVKTVATRLKQIIDRYGEERVHYAGPECGLKSFPTYESAVELLRRTAKATAFVNAQRFE